MCTLSFYLDERKEYLDGNDGHQPHVCYGLEVDMKRQVKQLEDARFEKTEREDELYSKSKKVKQKKTSG